MSNRLHRIARFTGIALAALTALPIAGLLFELVAGAIDARRFPPPGQLVDVGAGRLHIDCSGESGPVVLLDAGGGDSSLSWSEVQARLSRHARVCSYDRAGLGWSDAIAGAHTSLDHVSYLERLLDESRLEGPYVLVGHSFGGLNAQLFASRNPGRVAGLVLVDSAHPGLFERMPELKGLQQDFIRSVRVLAWFGVPRLAFALGLEDPLPDSADVPSRVRSMYVAQLSRARHWDEALRMNEHLDASLSQAPPAEALPDVPTVVITRGRAEEQPTLDWQQIEQVWQELQRELAEELPSAELMVAEQSGHLVPLEQPSAIVAAVQRVLERVRPSDR